MMNVKDLFSPLNHQYCDYFYFLSILFFVFFVLAAFQVVMSFFSKKQMKLTDCLILVTQPLLLYFINRLYYSMCVGALN